MTDSNAMRGVLTGGTAVPQNPAAPAQVHLPPLEDAQQQASAFADPAAQPPLPAMAADPAPPVAAAPATASPSDEPAAPPAQQQPSAIDELEALIAQSSASPVVSEQPMPQATPTMPGDPTPIPAQAPFPEPVVQQVITPDPTFDPPASQVNQQLQPQAQSQFDPAQQPVPLEPQESFQPDPTAQAVLSTLQQAPGTLNPANPAPASAKETFERPAAPDASSIDAGGAVQQVEVERNPELPVEVEGFLQRVEDFSAKQVQEVVIADGTNEQAAVTYPSRPVIILPITQDEEQKNKRKSPRNSIRWLIEWSHKVIKMFAGKVLYKTEETK